MDTSYNKNDLTQGVIWKKLLGFFFPILFGMLFQQLYNTADAVIVGKFVGTDALAAVGGSAAVLVNLIIGFFTGLASGATVFIAQLYGAKSYERLSDAVHTVVLFCIFIGALLTAGGYYLSPWALSLVDTPQDIMASSTQYLRIYFAGAIPMMLFNIGSGILRAVGDSKRPLYFLLVCCALNICLDLLFVIHFKMEVAGVAWATVISETVSAILVVVCLCKSKGAEKLHLGKLRLDMRSLKRTLYLGIPAGVQSAMYSISNIIIQTAVNALGISVIAAWSACGKFDGVYWMTSNSFGIAICAFAGQCLGAGKLERAKQGIRTCLFIALGTSAFLSVLLLTFARPGMHIITDDAVVIDYSIQMLWFFVPYYVVWAFIEILSNSLRGMGDAVHPMIICILGVCGLRMLWVLFVIPHWLTITSVSIIYPISWAVTALTFILYYFKGNWMKRCGISEYQS